MARVQPRAERGVIDGVVVCVDLTRTQRVVGRAEIATVNRGIRATLEGVLLERFRRARTEALRQRGGHGPHAHLCETLLDEIGAEGPRGGRHAQPVVARRGVYRGRRRLRLLRSWLIGGWWRRSDESRCGRRLTCQRNERWR